MNKRYLWLVIAERKDRAVWNRKARRKHGSYNHRTYTKLAAESMCK